MSAKALLSVCRQRDITLSVQAGSLRYRAPKGAITPELRAQLAACKVELVRLLDHPPQCQTGQAGQNPAQGAVDVPGTQDSVQEGTPSSNFILVRDAANLGMVRMAIDNTAQVALDLETTGLDPREDRIRLMTVGTDTIDGGRFTYIVDCFAVDPSSLFDLMAEKILIVHNAAFDLGFLVRLGFVPGRVQDTMLMAQLLAAGTSERCTLADCCTRYLSLTLAKDLQRSDWSNELTEEQLAYAVADVEVLVPLFKSLTRRIRAAGLERVAEIESRCLPALVWMAQQGVAFDVTAWEEQARNAADEARDLRRELDNIAPERPDRIFQEGAWNWDSPAQVKEALSRAGCLVENTSDEALADVNHPLAELVRRYRGAKKHSTTYGREWIKHVASDGRVYSNWRQLGAKTGRMSSGSPNLQNLPRDPRCRRCFVAPPGRILVKADYSQVELRIAAKVANETRMIDAYRRGEDLHTLTARRMTGKNDVTKEERQVAKPVNFGLIYGLGAPSLRRKAKSEYGLDLPEADARRYHRAFFATYPGIGRWHARIRETQAKETRTLIGRHVLVESGLFFGAKANYTIQGTGGDAIKLALALLWERREQCRGAFPVLVVHDEIVIEADASQADMAASWLQQAMLDALTPLLDPVPVEVEVGVGKTWGGNG